MKRTLSASVAFGFAFTSAAASAYPTSAAFSPEGGVHQFAEVSALSWTGVALSPGVSPGSTWTGLEAGLLPRLRYPGTPLEFGGLEAGFDVITPWGAGQVKPVFNARLGLLAEGGWWPSVAVGAMELSPSLPSMSFAHVSASRTFGPYGRLTLGAGSALGPSSQQAGTFPFPSSSSWATFAAYESPLAWDRVSAVVDHLGGTSEIGSTYMGLNLSVTPEASLGAGAFLSNDRTAKYDGVWTSLTVTFDVRKIAAPAR